MSGRNPAFAASPSSQSSLSQPEALVPNAAWQFGGPHYPVKRGMVRNDGHVDRITGRARCLVDGVQGIFLAETEAVLTGGTQVEVDIYRRRARPCQ